MNKTLFGLVVIVLIGTGAFFYFKTPATAPETETNTQGGDAMKNSESMMQPKEIELASLGDSKESGTATISEVNGKAHIELKLTGAPVNVPQPAHVHEGSCPTPGGIAFILAAPINGSSVTLIDVSAAELMKKLPLSIVVHKSAKESNVYVLCGDIMQDGMMKKDDGMMKSDDGMMSSAERSFDITAKDFSFSTSEIKVKKGDTVTMNITNGGGFHDWVLDEFSARVPRLNTGDRASVTFTADKSGTFEYYCSVGSHRQMGMKGTLIVK